MSTIAAAPFVRIDDRLIHGQVVTAWVRALGTRTIWVVSDRAASEPLEIILLQSSVPRHLSLSVLTVAAFLRELERQLPDKVMILLERIEDALTLCSHCEHIREVNLGGLRYRPGKLSVSRSVYVDVGEVNDLRQLADSGVQVFLQIVPYDPKVSVMDKLPAGL